MIILTKKYLVWINGKIKIQGLELKFRKTSGSITGWFFYHSSSTKHKIISFNENELFSGDHEKTHEIKTVLFGKIFNTNISE